ncbi:Chaperone protein DnaJ [Fulvivirga imtechensis AK7]|uniref:Chaperone protein DnaJ n=1 Tax=Fulvivirga imtechensis AK7 TaxID=1237149 RepID=L8JP82_9BACT|nr:DnaJ domain-containing protein [Fulvivirga imtechensis]ELR69309.1 Chaperone protein DnaJ [Fulvivirga imtechensis AK7]
MLDYYKILGITRNADHEIIKAAYKKLALKYHPDRNPNNKDAEECFKLINEAHQVLSNAHKKAQYDLILNYSYQSYEATQRTRTSSQHPPRRRSERSVYDRYGKQPWGYAPNYKTAPPYKIDKNYYKVQLFTLTAVCIVAILITGLIKINLYLEEQRALELKAKNDQILAQAQLLYDNSKYRQAFDMITGLIRDNPIESVYAVKKEAMLAGLYDQTIALYKHADYQSAVLNLEVLRDYQRPMSLNTWRMIADCNYQLKNYRQAIHALDYIFIRDKNNIELATTIGNIYYDHLGNISKALEYYNEAKRMFKDQQSSTYGKAFELVMSVKNTPPIYYELFFKRAEINMADKNFEEAITDYNWAIFLRPDSAGAYYYRGNCKQKTGKISSACRDWKNAADLGHKEAKQLALRNCSM